MDIETLIVSLLVYLFLVITIAKLGTYKACGGRRAFLVSFLLTPFIGIIYASLSPQKNTLKITHFRCHSCGLEYTTFHKYCPSCLKDEKKHRLEKIRMKTF